MGTVQVIVNIIIIILILSVVGQVSALRKDVTLDREINIENINNTIEKVNELISTIENSGKELISIIDNNGEVLEKSISKLREQYPEMADVYELKQENRNLIRSREEIKNQFDNLFEYVKGIAKITTEKNDDPIVINRSVSIQRNDNERKVVEKYRLPEIIVFQESSEKVNRSGKKGGNLS